VFPRIRLFLVPSFVALMKFDHRANRHVPVSEPLVINDPDQHPWDCSVDVAVVGIGIAGAAAALEAAHQGAQVLALDRLSGGGASALSGGVVYAGGGTRQQREAGIEDTPDNMYEYLRVQVGGVVSDATLRRFCQSSVANLEWLESFGVRFGSRYYKEKNSFPGGAWGIYHSGNEAYAPYNANTTTAARGHVTQGGGYFGGPALMGLLLRAMRQNQRITLQSNAEVHQLIVDRQNQVIGLRYRLGPQRGPLKVLRHLLHQAASKINIGLPRAGLPIRALAKLLSARDREQTVRVKNGVILSAGGFVFNKAMVEQATGAPMLTPHALGEDCNGSGIRLGLTHGAAIGRIERLTYWRFYAPPHAWLKAVAVGKQGQRLCNEALYGATVADVMLEKSGGRGWLILDQALMRDAWAQLRSDNSLALVQKLMSLMYIFRCTVKADDLPGLARKTGLPAEALARTLHDYNQRIKDDQPDEYAKPDKYRAAIGSHHYYAIDISIGSKFPCPTLTLGGLSVDEDTGQVVDEQGMAIPRLYAAGRNAVGLCAHTYISGLSLADGLFSGRRAGRHAARQFFL
jgi:3-oxo-5alpha-steroid 4-dehydrogenase